MILYVLALESDLRSALIMHKNTNLIGGGGKNPLRLQQKMGLIGTSNVNSRNSVHVVSFNAVA